MAITSITFKPLLEADFSLLLKWLEMPHVKAWWDQDVRWTSELIREKYGGYVAGYKLDSGEAKKINAYIISADQVPIGYIQIYNAYDFARSKPLIDLPESLAEVDFFIGEPSALGKSIGAQVLCSFLDDVTYNQYAYAVVDPDSSNIAAIKTYKKAGFEQVMVHDDSKEIWMLRKSLGQEILPESCVSIKNSMHFSWGDGCDGWWLKKNGNFTVVSEMMPSGTAEALHFHQQVEQFFYILDGALTMELQGKAFILNKDDSMVVPVGIHHRVLNHTQHDVRFLVVSCPDSHEDRVNL